MHGAQMVAFNMQVWFSWPGLIGIIINVYRSLFIYLCCSMFICFSTYSFQVASPSLFFPVINATLEMFVGTSSKAAVSEISLYNPFNFVSHRRDTGSICGLWKECSEAMVGAVTSKNQIFYWIQTIFSILESPYRLRSPWRCVVLLCKMVFSTSAPTNIYIWKEVMPTVEKTGDGVHGRRVAFGFQKNSFRSILATWFLREGK